MASTPKYTDYGLHSMNCVGDWRSCIKTDTKISQPASGLWELHATGYADMNGRKYQALPAGTKLTQEIKKKYNIW